MSPTPVVLLAWMASQSLPEDRDIVECIERSASRLQRLNRDTQRDDLAVPGTVIRVLDDDGVTGTDQQPVHSVALAVGDHAAVDMVGVADELNDRTGRATLDERSTGRDHTCDLLGVDLGSRVFGLAAGGDQLTQLVERIAVGAGDDGVGRVTADGVDDTDTGERSLLARLAQLVGGDEPADPDTTTEDLVHCGLLRNELGGVALLALEVAEHRVLDLHAVGRIDAGPVGARVHEDHGLRRLVGVGVGLEPRHQHLPGRAFVGEDQVRLTGNLVTVDAALRTDGDVRCLVGPRAPVSPPVEHLLRDLRGVDTVDPRGDERELGRGFVRRDALDLVLVDLARHRVDGDELDRNGHIPPNVGAVERRRVERLALVVDLDAEVVDEVARVGPPDQPFHVGLEVAARVVRDVVLLGQLSTGVGVLGVDNHVVRHLVLHLVAVEQPLRLELEDVDQAVARLHLQLTVAELVPGADGLVAEDTAGLLAGSGLVHDRDVLLVGLRVLHHAVGVLRRFGDLYQSSELGGTLLPQGVEHASVDHADHGDGQEAEYGDPGGDVRPVEAHAVVRPVVRRADVAALQEVEPPGDDRDDQKIHERPHDPAAGVEHRGEPCEEHHIDQEHDHEDRNRSPRVVPARAELDERPSADVNEAQQAPENGQDRCGPEYPCPRHVILLYLSIC